ncbi:mono/diheme cytochrome c family protein [Sphingobium jiangsuense]|uniref:Mono/diheme cytochrome c family protein n=1 Tax=Sphingobium jiangsuense TaxID=870476 RepID=A0A7W6BLZ6_9SPHN|nr:cytochrome c [Sphingobium jiangsuense]MBB3927411.1 mono/diheme cytochrome c family protein [Sphingobium jiangsuense]
MTHRLFLSLALGAAMALAACSGGKGDAPAAPKREGPPPPPAPETVSSRPDAGPGEKLFLAKCAMCHGPGGMGAGLLARRSDEPLLEKRTDLTPELVIQAARMGIGNMPAVPRGEVSDADLQQIADYLSKGNAQDNGGAQ